MVSNTSGDFLLNQEILTAGDFGRGDELSRCRIDDGDDKRPFPLGSPRDGEGNVPEQYHLSGFTLKV